MTDEMTVQAQRPSALPYVAGGAVVGGLTGAGLAKYANIGYSSPKYSNWEEAIKDSNDEFVKKQVEKGGDKKADWEKVQTAQKEVKEANEKVKNATKDLKPEEIKNIEEYMAKVDALEDAKAKAIADIKEKIAKGEMKEKVTKEVEEVVDKNLKDEALENKAKELLEKTNKAVFDKGAEDTEYKNALATIKEKITKGEMKENVTKEVEEVVDKTLTGDALENKAAKLLEKNKPESVTNAEKAIPKEKPTALTTEIENSIKEGKKALKAARDKAKTALTDDLLKGLKAPNWKITAGIGAIVLGLGALLLRPKADEVV